MDTTSSTQHLASAEEVSVTGPEIDLLTFADAIAESAESTNRHVLLGNGFSIACRPDAFSYGALLDEADFSAASPYVKDIFSTLGIADFEKVIELLQAAAVMAGLYGDTAMQARWEADAAVVREALAQVLAARHPSLPTEIEEHEFLSSYSIFWLKINNILEVFTFHCYFKFRTNSTSF